MIADLKFPIRDALRHELSWGYYEQNLDLPDTVQEGQP